MAVDIAQRGDTQADLCEQLAGALGRYSLLICDLAQSEPSAGIGNDLGKAGIVGNIPTHHHTFIAGYSPRAPVAVRVVAKLATRVARYSCRADSTHGADSKEETHLSGGGHGGSREE